MAATCKLLFGLSLMCGLVWGQAASTAQVNGVVRDSSGLAVQGAEVKATQTATGAVRTVITGSDGAYVLANLPIGPYLLTITKDGFGKYVQSGIVLQVDSNRAVDATLKIGSVNEQVTVQADAAMVETHSTGVGTVVDNQRVVELPLNGRNVTELIFLAGMSTPVTGYSAGMNSVRNYPTVTIAVAGGNGSGNAFLVDGTIYNDAFTAQNYPLPFPDALQEFKVETSALPAQYGYHSASVVNVVTKSGTNEFHGDLFEFLRNGDFNSRDFFAIARDTLKRNQFGGTIGAPIRKDKLFFFAGYQGTVQKSSPPQNIAYVPTPAMLQGDFTGIASPACNGGKQITLPASLGFVNNQISPSKLDPAALTLDARLPTPHNTCGQTTFGLLSNQNENLGVGRIDYQKSQRHSIFGRTVISDLQLPTTYDGKNALTLSQGANSYRAYMIALGDTYLLSSGMISSFRLGVNRMAINRPGDNFATWQQLGVNASSPAGKMVYLNVTGNGFQIGLNSMPTRVFQGPNPNLTEDISLIKGSHQFGFGADYYHSLTNFLSSLNTTGRFTFNGSVTGIPLADFMVGGASAWNQGNFNQWYQRQNYIGLYAQDSWKLNSRLTLTYGLRWEPYQAPYSKYGWYTHFDSTLFAQNIHSSVYSNAPAGVIFPGDSQYVAGKSPQKSDFDVWAPRVGLVWDPQGNGRMTIRAAYGIFNDRQHFQAFSSYTGAPPYGDNINLANVTFSNPWSTYPGGNPFPLPTGKNAIFPLFGAYRTDPFDYRPAYINQWNISIQRQVGADWLLTANYLGNSMIHLVSDAQLNPATFLGLGPCAINGVNYSTCSTTNNTNQRRILYLQNPSQGQYYAGVNAVDDGGTGTYDGLLLSVQRRLSHGVSALANYTWSHCISDIYDYSVGTGNAFSLPGNRRIFRGNCQSGDQRQVFNLSMVTQTPKFSNRAMRLIASDWQISPIMKIRSAQEFAVTTGVDGALTGQPTETPNLVGGVSPYVSDHGCSPAPCIQWLTPKAFAAPPAGSYGNLGLFNIKGPEVFQFDMALIRIFQVSEKKSIQLRVEAFNLPNTLNPAVPGATTNSGNFGQILGDISGTSGLSAGDPRIIQFAVKYVF